EARMPGAVGDRRAEIELLLVEGVGLVAPLVVLERRERFGVLAQPRLALSLQARADRAVEEARGDIDLAGLVRRDRRLRLAGDGHREPLRREVLHLEVEE